jgi:predicted Zn-dependent protease
MNLYRLPLWVAAFVPLLVVLSFGAVLIRAVMIQDQTDIHYRTLASQAMKMGDYDGARLYYSRLINDDRVIEPQDDFNWAQIIARDGESFAAFEIIEKLAPDNSAGYPDAHRLKAIQLSLKLSTIDRSQGGSELLEKTLEQLRHHLSRSGQANPLQLCDLWSAYYFASGMNEEGLNKIVESATYDPKRWLAAAIASEKQGDLTQRDRCYQAAKGYFSAQVESDPLDFQSRIALAKVLVDTDRVAEAETLLNEGLKLSDRAELRRTASDLRLFKISKVKEPLEVGFPDFNRLLAEAVALDPLNPQAYGLLLSLYQSAKSDEQRAELRERLERQVAKGEALAFAHFSLGSLYWLDGDLKNSMWHTEKALEIDPGLLNVANNVAWLLSQQENGDLERALKLINVAVEKRPDVVNYRDTKGAILMKMERWEDALIELETILPRTEGEARQDLHQRLAKIYTELGKESLAKMHEEEAAGGAK